MGHNFKEKSVFNIDRDKYESNYDKIFGNKKCQISECESETLKITIDKSEYDKLLDFKFKYEELCKWIATNNRTGH